MTAPWDVIGADSVKSNINALKNYFNPKKDVVAPQTKVDIVAIFDSTGKTQLFTTARPVKASVRETARVMEHPLESGAVMIDHRIINPVEIDLSMIFQPSQQNVESELGNSDFDNEYAYEYSKIRQAFLKSTLLTIQTNTYTYRNMIIASMPHEEEPAMIGTITMAITFREAKFAGAKFAKMDSGTTKSATDSNKKDKGQQLPAQEPSLLNRVIAFVTPSA